MHDENFQHHKYNNVMAADWIRDLNESASRIHKEKTIEKALMACNLGSSDAQVFLFNCYQAYNPFYTFNIRQVPETEGLTDRPNPWPKFWAMLEGLRTRTITGHQAKLALELMSDQFDSEEWNNLARPVLLKDLRAGISEKTLNKVLSRTEWAIPVFGCQLAQDSADQPKKLQGIKRLERKLDGVRVLAIVSGNACTLYSRNGKEFGNFPQIQQAILDNRRAFQHGRGTGGHFVLDGEIVGESFQKLMKQAQRKTDVQTDGMVYHIFDVLPLDNFREGHCNLQQHKRTEWTESARSGLTDTDCLHIVEGLDVDLDTTQGHDAMQQYAQDSVAAGFEGIMIKDPDAPYICKRSDSWMKWKPVISVDLKIVGFEQGTGRNLDRLGAIICEGEDNDRRICVNVGSGFSDADRDQYWTNRDHLLGHLVEVQADAVTQNQDGTYSLRFPRFLRFRDFDAGSKL
jgi:DNA ligase-1